jgi:hypothetical protein
MSKARNSNGLTTTSSDGDLTINLPLAASKSAKMSDGNSGCACFSIRLPASVPALRTPVVATFDNQIEITVILGYNKLGYNELLVITNS